MIIKILKYIGLVVCCALVSSMAWAQKNTVSFGIQYRPLIPNVVFDGEPVETSNDSVSAVISTKVGHSFGFLIRINFTDHWSLETGINQTKRNYSIDASSNVDNIRETFDLGMVTYEIPVQALYYVRFTEHLYMNALTGFSMNFYPTEHQSFSENNYFGATSLRPANIGWRGISLLANVGFEYRSDRAGYFYLGASLHRPVHYISEMRVKYRPDLVSSSSTSALISGNFLTIDFRYFFPAESKSKETKEKKAP